MATDPRKRPKIETLSQLRRRLHIMLAVTEGEFDAHIKQFNCRLDSSGCTDRAKFQERLQVLAEILKLTGGWSGR